MLELPLGVRGVQECLDARAYQALMSPSPVADNSDGSRKVDQSIEKEQLNVRTSLRLDGDGLPLDAPAEITEIRLKNMLYERVAIRRWRRQDGKLLGFPHFARVSGLPQPVSRAL